MRQTTDHTSKKLKLQAVFTTILVVPFVLQILVTVGLIGWLSLRSGERAVNQVANQLRDETTYRIRDQLQNFLETPHRINQANVESVRFGEFDFANIRLVELRFWRQIKMYPTISNIGFGSVSGTYIAGDRRGDMIRTGHKDEDSPRGALRMYETDPQGNPTLRLGYQGRANYDPRQRPWYQLGQTSPNGRWTEIFTYSSQPIYVISAVSAAYDQSGTFQGVFLSDLILTDISRFLQSLDIGKTGEAFILERSGQLVAASTPEIPYQIVEGRAQRLHATNSKSPLIQATATYLSEQFADLDQIQQAYQLDFTFDNKRQFVEIVPYSDPRGLDWLIVVVIPETDFMEGIYATARSTALLFLLALAIAISIGLLTARWLVRPIARLSAAATVLAEGNWDRTLPIEREDELGVLAEAFNRMAGRLKESLVAIKQREVKLSEAQRVAHVGSWEFDLDAQTVTWSDELFRICGLPVRSTAVGYSESLQLVHPDDVTLVRRAFEQAAQQGQPFEIDYRIVQPSGQIRDVHVKGQVSQNEGGQVHRIYGTVLDITERKQAELERDRLLELEQAARAEAESANQAKDRFLAVLSHELRTPLNPILGWTQLLQAGRLDAEQTTRALETIERNVKLQTQLIDDLLDVSRILRGKLSLDPKPVDLAIAISAAIETIRLLAEAKSIHIHTTFDPNPIYVNGDLARLQQIVWNLLSNAVKFTPVGGQVEVALEQLETREQQAAEEAQKQGELGLPAAYAQITVRDSGQGITTDFLPHLFDDFWQADSTSTRSAGGLGLGLAIARYLVQLHHGVIAATSEGLGFGSTFTVILPVLSTTAEGRTNGDRHSVMSSGMLSGISSGMLPGMSSGVVSLLQNINLLIVDDEPDNLEFLALLLRDQGATVTTTTTACEALQRLTQSLPDVLIADISMPEMDGYELIRRVRLFEASQQKAHPSPHSRILPAIALTAHAGEVNQQRTLAAGFQVHLTKPVEPVQLIGAIVQLLQ